MKREGRHTLEVAERVIHFRITERGRAIVVIPDNFKIDSYYHGIHIHPDRKEIPIKDPQIIYEIIYRHLLREGKIIDGKIRKELGL
ncbi:MAG: hypothetical protein B655_0988 [Methanobacterium sp. Maddingley MBC34]|nr:MAG: hypothetical protein B655_0988 [Methanobacterium sp. Maddingley MBC34]